MKKGKCLFNSLIFVYLITYSIIWIPTALAVDQEAETQAIQIINETGIKGGLVIHIGCKDGHLTAALRVNDSYIVHGIDDNWDNVNKARDYINSLGIYGKVSVDHFSGERLPYIENLVNLVVAEDISLNMVPEITRVLAPKGVAYIRQKGSIIKLTKEWPKEIDEWTHYLHDATGNPVAHDSVIGPPRHFQWLGSPRWSRHHDHMASMSALVSSNGRMFYIFDEGPTASIELPSKWSLIARDAFNGTILWKRDIPEWHTQLWPLKSGPAQLPRRLVASGETVYVTLGINAPLSALDAATGKTIRTYEGTKATEEVILSDGILFLLVDENPDRTSPVYNSVQVIRKAANETAWDAPPRAIIAIRADTGETLWRKPQTVIPLTLAAEKQRLFFHDGNKIICLDTKSGEEKWVSKPLPRWETIRTYFAPTLVVYNGVVLFAGGEKMIPHRGGDDTMAALSAETGEILWTAPHPPGGYQSPEDIIVAGGLVWAGATTNGAYSGIFTGRDLYTGEVRNEFGPDVQTYWFHHRCYRAKATDKYLLTSRTGIEFLDINANHWICNHWVRGGCLYGIMPCNGLIYTPPHDCACYIEAKLFGFNALAPASPSRQVPQEISDADRLEKGPAYDREVQFIEANSEDWPTYRHDSARSGATKTPISNELEETWRKDFGEKLTSVVVANRKVYLASIDSHTLYALDGSTGKVIWRFTAGGRVDSPPTIYQGRVLFGSADGRIYCLRADDGELIWRFRAAPVDWRIMAFEQLESVWPVHGSVLIQDDMLYCVAGRSMFLDGGLRFLKLDPKTGTKLAETILDDNDPETNENLQKYVTGLNMTVALPDILSSDGKNIYMRSMPFDFNGIRRRIAYIDVKQQKGDDVHLFAPTGFLDGSWWHRSYWLYGRSMASGAGGYYLAGRMAPAGRIMVMDDTNIYGFGRKPQYYQWTTPLEYQLFATNREIPEPKVPKTEVGSCIKVPVSESLNPANAPLTVEAWIKADKGNGVVLARGAGSNGYSLLLMDGKPHFMIRSNAKLSSVMANQNVVGKWCYLVGMLTSDKKLQIYVNGKLAGSNDGIDLIAGEPKQAMEIGADEGGAVGDYKSPFAFTGIIDEVRVYKREISKDEIQKHYTGAIDKTKQDPNLVLYFSFDEGDAKDGSGNNNNGTISDASSVAGKFGKAMKFTGATKSTQGTPEYVVKHNWKQDIPLQVRAMVLADKTMFIAGLPDVLDEEDAQNRLNDPDIQEKFAEQTAALEGKKGALLWAVSIENGEKLAEYKLDSLPEWDGMAGAYGKLYFTTVDGKLVCYGK